MCQASTDMNGTGFTATTIATGNDPVRAGEEPDVIVLARELQGKARNRHGANAFVVGAPLIHCVSTMDTGRCSSCGATRAQHTEIEPRMVVWCTVGGSRPATAYYQGCEQRRKLVNGKHAAKRAAPANSLRLMKP